MRFLECPPDLGEEGHIDEADRFYDDPLHWLRTSFPYKSSLPTHLVLFNILEKVRYSQMKFIYGFVKMYVWYVYVYYIYIYMRFLL